MTTALVVGFGEIGKALASVLSKVHEVYVEDPGVPAYRMGRYSIPFEGCNPDVMHICIPWSESFINAVRDYMMLYEPMDVVIHSTVPVGTSFKLGALHSPVVGIHPNLAESLTAFTKFLGGPKSDAIAQHLRQAGMRVYPVDRSQTTEMLKILSTTFYAVCIEFTKDVKRLCFEHGAPFEAWTLWTESYNQGYQALGRPEFTRPNLVPLMGRLGGHCLLPNCDLLDTDFTELVKERNK